MQNQTQYSNLSGLINHVEIFNGFYSFQNAFFLKCFMIKYNIVSQRKIKLVEVKYDHERLASDLDVGYNLYGIPFYISAHYLGQFFLENELREATTEALHGQFSTIWFKEVEFLKRRNSRRRKCLDIENEYDNFLVDKLLHKKGCRVPYLHNHKLYLKCKD